jgi:hypothetical protein
LPSAGPLPSQFEIDAFSRNVLPIHELQASIGWIRLFRDQVGDAVVEAGRGEVGMFCEVLLEHNFRCLDLLGIQRWIRFTGNAIGVEHFEHVWGAEGLPI